MYIFSRSTWLRRFTQTTSNGWRCRLDSSCRGVLKIRRNTTESTTPRSSFVPSSSTRSSGPSREPSRTNISKSRILRGRQSLTTPKIGNLKSATTTTSTLINVATCFCSCILTKTWSTNQSIRFPKKISKQSLWVPLHVWIVCSFVRKRTSIIQSHFCTDGPV